MSVSSETERQAGMTVAAKTAIAITLGALIFNGPQFKISIEKLINAHMLSLLGTFDRIVKICVCVFFILKVLLE